jgi:hypothetical protein
MWGNKEGWIISGIIVVLMGWMIWTLGRVEPIAKPSGQFSNLEEPIKLPVAPAEIIPGVMTEDRDAGDLYRQAIELYREKPKTYDKFEVTRIAEAKNLPALELVLQAGTAKRAKIFIDAPQTLVNYNFPWPELDAIFHLGQLSNSVGHYYVVSKTNSNEELAKKYLHAGFSLGAKLYEERLVHAEMMNGIKLMQGAVDSLKELAKRKGDAAREQQLEQFGKQTTAYYSAKVQKLYEKVVTGAPADVATYSGDVFALAMKNPDRMWRTEAILKVGRYRYEKGGRPGDQIWATRMLNEPQRLGITDFAEDPDPAVRAAGVAAKGLTVEQFRMIR